MNKETDPKLITHKEAVEEALSALRLKENATEQEINKAYRTLSRNYHPDKQVGKSQEVQKKMQENFERVNKAYGILTKSITENLFDALANENLEESRNFLREVPNLNVQQYVSQYLTEFTPIHLIVRNIGETPGKGWEKLLEQIVPMHRANNSELLKPININISVGGIGTPLHMACFKQSLHAVRHLLKAGADPNIKNDMGFTPTDFALTHNNYDILKVLIDHGAKFDDERNKNEIDTVIKLLPYILDGRKNAFDINTKFFDPDSWLEADTVLSYAAANNLRDDKGTLMVQQLFDHYKNDISPETVYSALTATNDNSLDSVKIILQNSHGLQKDHFNSILDTRFNAEQYENYRLILSHVAKQGYNDVINQQHSQITRDLDDYKSFGDDQGVEKCNRFLEIHRTISSPEHSKEGFVAERVKLFEGKDTQERNRESKDISEIKKGLVADKMKLFQNTDKQEQKSTYKGTSEIKKGSVAEKIAKFSAQDNQKNDQKSDIREQPSTRVQGMVNKLEEKSNKGSKSSNQEKSKKVDKALSNVNVLKLKQKFEER